MHKVFRRISRLWVEASITGNPLCSTLLIMEPGHPQATEQWGELTMVDNGWLLTATHSISCLQDLAIETCLHYAITPFRSRKSHCPRCPERQLIMVSPAPRGVLVLPMEAHVEATDVESRGLRLLVEVLLGLDLLLAWFLMILLQLGRPLELLL